MRKLFEIADAELAEEIKRARALYRAELTKDPDTIDTLHARTLLHCLAKERNRRLCRLCVDSTPVPE